MKESFLIDVLKKGVSPFHCVEAAMQTLEESGFEELEYARPWNLKKGKAYMMNHHGTTLYAFTVGENFRADACCAWQLHIQIIHICGSNQMRIL